MGQIPVYTPSAAGTAPLLTAAANGDTAPIGRGYVLRVKNGDASSHTVTITTPGTLGSGASYPDKAVTVAAGAEAWIPLIDDYRDPADQQAHIAYDALTSVTRVVQRPWS